MLHVLTFLFEALILASAVSLDCFAASFAYGSHRIKIPLVSVHIINGICSLILGISLLAGTLIRPWIPAPLTTFLSFGILFILGVMKLLDSITKSLIRKYNHWSKKIQFSCFNFRFVLQLYADPEAADIDQSRDISPMEAVSLAFALSLDGIAVGVGAGLGSLNVWAVILCSLVTGGIALLSGGSLGRKLAKNLPFDLSWISGVILMLLALSKL